MKITVEWFFAGDGKWAAESPQVPGARAYAADKEGAIFQAQVRVLRYIADHFEAEGHVPVKLTLAVSPMQSPQPSSLDEADELYDRWLAAEVAEAINDDSEPIPHAEALRSARAAFARR